MMRSCFVYRLLTAFFFLTASLSLQGREAPKGRYIGPAVYGSVFAVDFHPNEKETFVVGTDMGMFFITRDTGKSWTVIEGDGTLGHAGPGSRGAWSAAFDPVNPDTLWLGGQLGLFKSVDGGRTASLKLLSMIGCIAVDPRDPNVIYAGNGAYMRANRRAWSPGLLYKTVDGGKNWQPLLAGVRDEKAAAGRNWTRIVIDSSSAFIEGEGHQRIYAIEHDVLWVSENAGRSWQSLAQYAPGIREGGGLISDLNLIPRENGQSTLVAAFRLYRPKKDGKYTKEPYQGGPYRSEDHGKTWQPLTGDLVEKVIPQQGASQWWHSTIGWSPASPNTLHWGTMHNTYRSDDFGQTWKQLMRPALDEEWFSGWGNDTMSPLWNPGDKLQEKSLVNNRRLYSQGTNFTKPFYGYVWAGNSIAVSPVDAGYVLHGGSAVRLTTDGGETWDEPLFEYGEPHKPGHFGDRPPMLYTHRVRSTGPQVIVPTRMAIDPFNAKNLAIGYMDFGLFLSRDGGTWWEWGWEGMQGTFAPMVTRAVVYDPAVEGRMYVVVGKYAPSGLYPYRSDDGGRTFTPIIIPPLLEASAKGDEKALRHCLDIAVDFSTPPEARTLYVASTLGIYKSTDGGKQWKDISHNLPPSIFKVGGINDATTRLTFAPDDPKILYFTSNGTERLSSGSKEAGIYATHDGGETWKRLAKNEIGPVSSISISPKDPQLLYVVAAEPGTLNVGVSTPSYLWRSRDRGESWEKIAMEGTNLTGAFVHPVHSERVYLLTHTIKEPAREKTALLKTTDGGASWRKMEVQGLTLSLNPFYGNDIYFSPHNANHLFLLTFCGVWEFHDNE